LLKSTSKCPKKRDSGTNWNWYFYWRSSSNFNEASKALLEQIDHRKTDSFKRNWIYFVTQNPMDVPSGVLAQLGLKYNMLWAFTANDRQLQNEQPTTTPLLIITIQGSIDQFRELQFCYCVKWKESPLLLLLPWCGHRWAGMGVLWIESEIQDINNNQN
jgi:hypothetical protein